MLDTISKLISNRRNSSGYSVYFAKPGDISKNGSDSWQCKSDNQNLDSEKAKQVALELEDLGHLVRVVPAALCQSNKWRVS